MVPEEDRRALTTLRGELAAVREELARKSRRYRQALAAGIVVLVGMAVVLGVGVSAVFTVRHNTDRLAAAITEVKSNTDAIKGTTAASSQRGIENKALLESVASVLAAVNSVTNPTAQASQSAATRKLVDDLVCRIYLGLKHSDPTLGLPAGCGTPP